MASPLGPQFAATLTAGGIFATNPTYVAADDTSYATSASLATRSQNTSDYTVGHDLSTVPDNAIITQIVVSGNVRCSAVPTGVGWGICLMKAGTTVVGTEVSGAIAAANTDYVKTQTITTGLPTVAQLKATGATGLRVSVRCYTGNVTTARVWSLDYTKITVTYTVPQTYAATGAAASTTGIAGTCTVKRQVFGGGGTFGKTDLTNATADLNIANYLQAARFVLSESAAVSKLTVYLGNVAGSLCHVMGVIYAEGTDQPTTRLGVGAEMTIAAAAAVGWYDLTFPSAVNLSAGTYWLCFIGDGACTSVTPYWDLTSGYGGYGADTYVGGPENPAVTLTTKSARTYCIYATYTTGAAVLAGAVATGISGTATVTLAGIKYPATGSVGAVTGLSGTANVKRAATGAAGSAVTGLSATAKVARRATGVSGAVVTGISGTATVRRAATGSVGAVTGLSGTAFRRYLATGTVGAVTTATATPTTKRASTGPVSAATGFSGTATARHLVTGLAGAVVTGTIGAVTVKRLAGTAAPSNVVTGISGAATVTEAPTGNYATGQVDAVTGLSGRANVTRKATGSVSSITGLSGSALAKYGVTGSVSSATGVSGSAKTRRVATGRVDVVTGASGTPRDDAVKYPASGRFDVVTTIWDATVYAAVGLISTGASRGMATPGKRRGFASTGSRGITGAAALGRGRNSEGHERTTP